MSYSPQVRTVKHSGEAWIVVPIPPKDGLERVSLSTLMFVKAEKMLQRRLTISGTIVRCPTCLPSTLEWYRGLATVMQRVMKNVPLVQDPNNSEFEMQHSLTRTLQCAEPQLVEAAKGVIMRSSKVSSGKCGWCGECWGQTNGAPRVVGTRHEVGVPHVYDQLDNSLSIRIYLIKRYYMWMVAITIAVVAVLVMIAQHFVYGYLGVTNT